MRLNAIAPQRVEFKGVRTPGGEFDIALTVAPPKFSLLEKIAAETDEKKKRGLLPMEEAASRIVDWEGEAFTDEETGQPVPCTPEAALEALQETPGLYSLVLAAFMTAYWEATLKNSATSPAGTTTAERGSVQDAGPTANAEG